MKKNLVLMLALALSIFGAACGEATDNSTSEGEVGVHKYALTSQEPTCQAFSAPILLSGTIGGGAVVVSNDGTNLTVTVTSNAVLGWKIHELFLYVGTGALPTDPVGGWVDLQQFNVKRSYYPGTTGATFTFPLATFFGEQACGQQLTIGAYVAEKQYAADGVTVLASKSGWAYSPGYTGSTCACQPASFTYTVCCEPTGNTGCTYTQGYWKNHNEVATRKSQKINWPAPMDENQLLCAGDSRTLLTLLKTPPASGDAYLILAHQYIAAKLNVASGASTTTEVDNALAAAKVFLETTCPGPVHSSTDDGYWMTLFAGVLDSYNNGFVGPGHCAE